jgi:hypothetical protein
MFQLKQLCARCSSPSFEAAAACALAIDRFCVQNLRVCSVHSCASRCRLSCCSQLRSLVGKCLLGFTCFCFTNCGRGGVLRCRRCLQAVRHPWNGVPERISNSINDEIRPQDHHPDKGVVNAIVVLFGPRFEALQSSRHDGSVSQQRELRRGDLGGPRAEALRHSRCHGGGSAL